MNPNDPKDLTLIKWADKCEKCGGWFLKGQYHKCPPEWEVCFPHCDGEWKTVIADDCCEAAEVYAEADPEITDDLIGYEYAFVVKNPRTGEMTRVLLSAEMVPQFYSSESECHGHRIDDACDKGNCEHCPLKREEESD
jgi:hypothetical protein